MLQAHDPSTSKEAQPPTGQPKPLAPLVPVRRKSERMPSTSGHPAEPAVTLPYAPIPPIPSSPPTLFSALRSLFLYISSHPKERGTISPRAFIDKIKELNELFRGTMHQDAHEFLMFLLNRIVEEIEEERKQLQNGGAKEEEREQTHTVGYPREIIDPFLQCRVPMQPHPRKHRLPLPRAQIQEQAHKMLLLCINYSKAC